VCRHDLGEQNAGRLDRALVWQRARIDRGHQVDRKLDLGELLAPTVLDVLNGVAGDSIEAIAGRRCEWHGLRRQCATRASSPPVPPHRGSVRPHGARYSLKTRPATRASVMA
jgi:hypothetical protein